LLIRKIFDPNHAFVIESDNAVEILVQFGVDTDLLKGEGFMRVAHEGSHVKAGDTIIEFNLAWLEENAKSTLSPIVISNMDDIKELTKFSGSVVAGGTPILRIIK